MTALLIAAATFYAAISPEVSAEIQGLAISGEYREYLDYNGGRNAVLHAQTRKYRTF